MSISSLVMHVRPEAIDAVTVALGEFEGVELHAVTEDSRLVVTVDQPDNRKASDTLTRLQGLSGVLNASLIYNYFEPDTDAKEEGDDSL
ncbi:MAG: chaperone NapD [Rhodobacterales bacterium]|nr:chaperone NapD [Rhodobacterales bacterium]